jgi:hypothetical protein
MVVASFSHGKQAGILNEGIYAMRSYHEHLGAKFVSEVAARCPATRKFFVSR